MTQHEWVLTSEVMQPQPSKHDGERLSSLSHENAARGRFRYELVFGTCKSGH